MNSRKFLSLFCLILATTFICSCGQQNQVDPRLNSTMPQRFLWAWERPEDLRFIDVSTTGVAFLAQTLYIEKDTVIYNPRKQPLLLPENVYLIAVTRIETRRQPELRPDYSAAQIEKAIDLIKRSLDRPNVKAVQIDFDAVASERDFYKQLMAKLRPELAAEVPLTMTSLASWCVGDAWFNDMPVSEAVPMAFEMGADDENIRRFLRDGKDWKEPLCRGSYGISVDEPLTSPLMPGRRVFLFKRLPWKPSDLALFK